MLWCFMAREVHQIIMPDKRSTTESTRLDMIESELDKPTAIDLAINKIWNWNDANTFIFYIYW